LKDFDVQVFFKKLPGYKSRDSSKFNRHGGIWPAGSVEGIEIEVFYNLLYGNPVEDIEFRIIEKANRGNSERWKRIRKSPFLILFPMRKDLESL